MHSTLVLLALPTLALAQAAASPDTGSGGSLEKLLDRVAAQKHALRARDLESHHDVLDKLNKRGGIEGKVRRWVWGTSIIQDTSPTQGIPAPGADANLLSSNAMPVNTPTATIGLVSPSILPPPSSAVDSAPTAAAAIPAPASDIVPSAASDLPVAPSSIASNIFGAPEVPPEGVAAFAALETPTFTIKDAGYGELPTILRERSGNVVAGGAGHQHQQRHHHPNAAKMVKKWVWGASIIQDASPTEGLPAPGQNANMLSSNSVAANTPAANLVAPTFPPRPSLVPYVPAAAAPPKKVTTTTTKAAAKPAATTSKAAAKVVKPTTTTTKKHHHKKTSSTTKAAASTGAPQVEKAAAAPVVTPAVVVPSKPKVESDKRGMRRMQKAGAGVVEHQ